ncbi:MAG: Mo-dependent nitrogenase C-terminal domain-containing protein [Microcoleaceae cyanobacterium]
MIDQISQCLNPLRQWLDALEISNPKLALLIYRVIPGQCPFEREIKVFGHTLLRIPPLCKLNPLYEQAVGLRFRAMCYLVDECGMNVA